MISTAQNLNNHTGTKHIDPDTGLIYFKYDFGYEFGILFPGEGKKLIAGSSHQPLPSDRASSVPPSRKHYIGNPISGDLNIPVKHERTADYANGYASETELLQNNQSPSKRWSLPVQIDIDSLHSPNGARSQSALSGRSSSASRGLQTGDFKDIDVLIGIAGRFNCFVAVSR